MCSACPPRSRKNLTSFTLVELLVVMFIIAILTAIILAAAQGVMTSAARSRTRTEIQAMSAALESYKTDNGIYIPSVFNGSGKTADYVLSDGSATGPYVTSSQLLYQALAGKINSTDVAFTAGKGYMAFKANELGNPNANTYVEDPSGYSYGYNTGNAPIAPVTTQAYPPYNGTGFFDLWSTGGVTLSQVQTTPTLTNTWINNWSAQ